MPLADFISEVMQFLGKANLSNGEVLVECGKTLVDEMHNTCD